MEHFHASGLISTFVYLILLVKICAYFCATKEMHMTFCGGTQLPPKILQ